MAARPGSDRGGGKRRPRRYGDTVTHLIWERRPTLHQPVMIVAFEGWNDAAQAATQAIEALAEQWNGTSFASIDPEEFYDFTTSRPEVRLEGDERRIEWPTNVLYEAHATGPLDLVLVRGVEPQLRWRTFANQIADVAVALRARLVLSLGALLAEVPHSRPTTVFGTSDDRHVLEALSLEPSRYEGPTGIVGVLLDECRRRGVNGASLWAAVPSYIAAAPSPKAAMALVDRVGRLLGIPVSLDQLTDAATDYERQISELVAEDPETSNYVRHLEERADEQAAPVGGEEEVDRLVAEVERFLREQ